jgi:hypothetical protein
VCVVKVVLNEGFERVYLGLRPGEIVFEQRAVPGYD